MFMKSGKSGSVGSRMGSLQLIFFIWSSFSNANSGAAAVIPVAVGTLYKEWEDLYSEIGFQKTKKVEAPLETFYQKETSRLALAINRMIAISHFLRRRLAKKVVSKATILFFFVSSCKNWKLDLLLAYFSPFLVVRFRDNVLLDIQV